LQVGRRGGEGGRAGKSERGPVAAVSMRLAPYSVVSLQSA